MGKAIILVGPDKAGKSTLTENLQKAYPDMLYRKGLKLDIKEMQTAVIMEIGFLNSSDKLKIYDRFHYPDELIYGSLNRNKPMDESLQKWFDPLVKGSLKRAGALFVYCNADLKELEERFIASGETDIKVDWLKKLSEAYEKWFEENKDELNILKLDSSKLSKEEMFNKVKEEIEK